MPWPDLSLNHTYVLVGLPLEKSTDKKASMGLAHSWIYTGCGHQPEVDCPFTTTSPRAGASPIHGQNLRCSTYKDSQAANRLAGWSGTWTKGNWIASWWRGDLEERNAVVLSVGLQCEERWCPPEGITRMKPSGVRQTRWPLLCCQAAFLQPPRCCLRGPRTKWSWHQEGGSERA